MKPIARTDVVFRQLGEEYAILDPQAHTVHVLSPSAAAVWVLCDGSRELSEIALEVADAFGVTEPAHVLDDVTAAVDSFLTLNLVRGT